MSRSTTLPSDDSRSDPQRRSSPKAALAPPRILIAEDDADVRAVLVAAMRSDGFDVLEARHGGEVLRQIGSWLLRGRGPRLDMILSDVRMPGLTGLELLAGLRQAGWRLPILLVTAYGSNELREEAEELGALLLEKPLDIDDLRTVVWNLLSPPAATAVSCPSRGWYGVRRWH